jgi:hypothetical protein
MVVGVEAQGRGFSGRTIYDPCEVAEVARAMGAEVVEGDWGGRGMGGEQTARDLMLARALVGMEPGDLVLWFDCDERPVNLSVLVEWVERRWAPGTRRRGAWQPLLGMWINAWKRLSDGRWWVLPSGLVAHGGQSAVVHVACGLVVGSGMCPVSFPYSRRPEGGESAEATPLALWHDSWDCGGAGPREKFLDWSHRAECSQADIDAFCRAWDLAGDELAPRPIYPLPGLSGLYRDPELWDDTRVARVLGGDVRRGDL